MNSYEKKLLKKRREEADLLRDMTGKHEQFLGMELVTCYQCKGTGKVPAKIYYEIEKQRREELLKDEMNLKLRHPDPCFWMEDDCPKCGYRGPHIYMPDLISPEYKFQVFECNREKEGRGQCGYKWTTVLSDKKRQEVIELLRLRRQQDELIKTLREKYNIRLPKQLWSEKK